jgi:hypothetical protein
MEDYKFHSWQPKEPEDKKPIKVARYNNKEIFITLFVCTAIIEQLLGHYDRAIYMLLWSCFLLLVKIASK